MQILYEHARIIIDLLRFKGGRVSGLTIGQQIKLTLIQKYLRKHFSIIDIGCGTMWLTKYLRRHGHTCVGFADEPPADILGDIRRYRFTKQYDVVIALEIIEHVECTKELISILKPGGLLIMSSPKPSMDWVCLIGEKVGLFQKRTSPHTNLRALSTIPLAHLFFLVLFGVDQFGIFQKPG